jgi:hypothetical protein
MPVVLANDSFLTRRGFYPKTGAKCKVRYRFYPSVGRSSSIRWISNQGRGSVPPKILAAARYDSMSIRHVPQTLRSCFTHSVPTGSLLGGMQLPTLGELTPQRAAAALALLKSYDQVHYYRREARNLLNAKPDKKQKPSPQALRGLENIRKLLAGKWTAHVDRSALLRRGIGAIVAQPQARKPATPEGQRLVTWCLLQELLCGTVTGGYSSDMDINCSYYGLFDEPASDPPARLKPALIAECRRTLTSGPDKEKGFAASILTSDAIGAGLVKDTELAELVANRHPAVWRWAAISLIKRKNRDLFVKSVQKRPKSDWKDAIFMLSVHASEPMEPKERAFWLDFGKADAAFLSYVLVTNYSYKNKKVPVEFQPAVRSYLRSEIANPMVRNAGSQPFYNLRAALQVLAAWDSPQDTSLLKRFLNYPISKNPKLTKEEANAVKLLKQQVETLLIKR